MVVRKTVNSDTTAHCFSEAGFGITNHNMNVEEDLTDEKDWHKVSDNQAITSTDLVNCDTDVVTTALLSAEEICDATSTDKDIREESDEDMEKQPVPTFLEAVGSFQTVRQY
jgi:hypothetical protein